jgi:hypothetical protein
VVTDRQLPPGLGYSETIFTLTANRPYTFGAVTQLVNEAYEYDTFNTGSTRNIYSPDVIHRAGAHGRPHRGGDEHRSVHVPPVPSPRPR